MPDPLQRVAVNRKQRRANKLQPASLGGAGVQDLFASAVQSHRDGRLADAEQLYRHVLALEPRHADSLHRLGVLAHQECRHALAAEYLRKAIAQDAKVAVYHSHLGLVLDALDRSEEALACCRTAIALEPNLPDTHNNLGVMLARSGRLEEAADCYRSAIALQPRLPEVHNNLGNVLLELGRPQEAAASYRNVLALAPDFPEAHANLGNALLDQDLVDEAVNHCRHAIALAPGFADAHNNLGNALCKLGRIEEAASSYRRAIELRPEFAKAHANLGGVLKSNGQLAEAVACFQRALQLDPGRAEIWNNLALAFMAFGEPIAALDAITRSLSLGETPENRRTFVHCIKDLQFEKEAGELRPLLVRALREGWDRPDDLARISADLIKHNCEIVPLMKRAPGRDFYDAHSFAALAGDDLLQALLCRTANLDMELERLLTMVRRIMLQTAMNQDDPPDSVGISLDFRSALAQQCFINEYVFFCDGDELQQAHILRELLVAALESGQVIHPHWIATAAAYFPLSSVPLSSRLLDASWPATIEAILTQQIREPEEEARLRATIPRLTRIEDGVSRSVQAQYEENPYPRWVEAGAVDAPEDLTAHLRQKFPFAIVENIGSGEGVDILVAGCGTGRNAIETTRRFKGARTLAVDLSLNSLGYAVRKSRERNIPIDYAQADLLELGSMGRRFDMIEAVGVLHHLADPFAGWRVLLSLLKPRGVMMLGFYSAAARRNLPDMRNYLAGGGPTADGIRAVRQRLAGDDDQQDVTQRPDFFSISSCRDLLFHVQEHRVPLDAIGAFLRDTGLKLIGFSVDDAVLAAYRRRFPADPGAADLDRWQEFEAENPDTFSGMYQFWLQKVP